MYLQNNKVKEKRKVYEYSFSDGLENGYDQKGGRIVGMKNISPATFPCLSPRDPYYVWDINNSMVSLGVIDGKSYYVRGTDFYYDGQRIGGVARGKKQFVNYNNQVLIFPDNMCYDVDSGHFGYLCENINTTIRFINSSLGVNAIKSASAGINLTDSFYKGQGILISGSGNSIVDGYHYIVGVDKQNGVLYFKNYEFGNADIPDLVCEIKNEIPTMDGVCVCQDRIWGVAQNKVYASKQGDPKSFCAFGCEDSDSFVCECNDTDGFMCCVEYSGYPLIFSRSGIFKVYGDSAQNYELERISNRGGVEKGDADSICEVDGEIFYLSFGEFMKFTGAKCERITSFPYGRMRNGVGGADKGIYFISCNDENIENRFFVYDTRRDIWCEHEGVWINKILRVDDALYGLSSNKAYLLNIPRYYPTDTTHEGRVKSEVELDDVFELNEKISPHKIIMRGYVATGGELQFEICYDGNLLWEKIGEITSEFYGIYELLAPIKKCSSFRLRIKGEGHYCIKNLAVECVGQA